MGNCCVRIYAMGFGRVKHHWHRKASVDTAFLDSHNMWEPFSDTRASVEEGKLVLVEVDEGETWVVAAPDGTELRVEEEGDDDYICL